MSLSIRTVKKEIRILGLDTCKEGEVFGAIIRGGFFLDGAFRLPLPSKQPDRVVAGQILGDPHYPELRAIMLHDPAHELKPAILEKHTRLPVMEIAKAKETKGKYSRFRSSWGELCYRTRLPARTSRQILSLTWTRGALPEQARVAHVLAESHLQHRPDK